MTTSISSTVRNNIRESRVTLNRGTKLPVNTENLKKSEDKIEKLTLPEIKDHLDYMLKETKIKYSIDEQDNGFIIKVMDKKTDKLIKEIPSHEIQVLRKHFKNNIGMLFNELI